MALAKAAGAAPDLVIVDSDTAAEASTFEGPRRLPVGIRHVLVNGVAGSTTNEPRNRDQVTCWPQFDADQDPCAQAGGVTPSVIVSGPLAAASRKVA